MELIKYFTREFTLLEHELIVHTVMGRHKVIPEISYSYVVDVSRHGLIEVYILKRDFDNNTRRVFQAVSRDRSYLSRMLDKGIAATRELMTLPECLPLKIAGLSSRQSIVELKKLRRKLLQFGNFIELTHYVGRCGLVLTPKEISKLGKFHDNRKQGYMAFIMTFNDTCSSLAKKHKLRSSSLGYLTFNEIVSLIQGKLKPSRAYRLQQQRRQRHICIFQGCKERIITKGFERELKKLSKSIIKDKGKQIKGQGINSQVVSGRVQVLRRRRELHRILPGSIVVTHMTSPDMTPVLKKCRAIVTDDGGLLCHAANLAREFKIPAVTGTKIATKIFKDGDIIEVDANKGTVRRLK